MEKMKMKTIIRKRSVLTEKNNLEHLYTFKKFPVFIGATNQPSKNDLFEDLSIAICPETGIIQLDRLIPPEIIYSGYHSEALGKVWDAHHSEFAQFILPYQLKKILEIGGSDGKLALKYIDSQNDVTWSIVEPNPTPFTHPSINFVIKSFDSTFHPEKSFDAIVHSHTFEHMYFPREFLATISSLLKTGQYHIFSVPNLFKYLENKFTNILNFEHTIFLTEYFIDYLLSEYDFEIVEKKYFQDHSIFYCTKKVSKKPHFAFSSRYTEYKNMYSEYLQSNKKIIDNLNTKISKANGGIYLFGAHVFSQLLLNQGMDKTRIKGILDNSKIKQGKRLYGTPLQIFPLDILKNQKEISVILKAGAYQEEIKKQIESINPKVIIWE